VKEASQRHDDLLADVVALGRTPSQERRDNAMLRSGLASANIRLEQARLDRRRATLFAPFDGVIDRVSLVEGKRSDQGDATVTLVDLVHLRIEAQVLEHDFPLIREGGEAIVSSAAAPDVLVRGTITNVLPLVDSASKSGRVYIRLTGNGVLRPGMSVDVRLEARRLPNRRLVPARAIVMRDDRPLVFVVRDGRAQWTYVELGRSNGFETEILPDTLTREIPVRAGEMVITVGHFTLPHDALVTIVAKDEIKR
jgi:HlyD family secretion protein